MKKRITLFMLATIGLQNYENAQTCVTAAALGAATNANTISYTVPNVFRWIKT